MANRRPWNWKRTLFRVGVFLLLGAIVNVAVAWGCSLLSHWETSHEAYDGPKTGFGIRFSFAIDPMEAETTVDVGWPVLSCRRSHLIRPDSVTRRSLDLPAYVPANEFNPEREVPYLPLWPGFAINTIFYAAILALLFYGPGKVRRMVRVRRSQCPACGHIIASGTCANGLCSECGSPLPKGFKPRPEASAKP